MRLLADLHTHSIASGHAYSTVSELASAAAERGLELIAVTDHGPAMIGSAGPIHFWNFYVLPPRLSGVVVLGGIEANPALDSDNGLDLPDEILSRLDFVAVGMHPGVGLDPEESERNTAALLRALANPLVDMVTHPGNVETYGIDPTVVLDAAQEYGLILELNDHTFEPGGARAGASGCERAIAKAAYARGIAVAISSDAHYHGHVGRFDRALAVAEELGMDETAVVNRDAASVLAHLRARRPRPRLAGIAEA